MPRARGCPPRSYPNSPGVPCLPPHPSRRLLAPLGCGPALGSPPCSPSSPVPSRCPHETGLPLSGTPLPPSLLPASPGPLLSPLVGPGPSFPLPPAPHSPSTDPLFPSPFAGMPLGAVGLGGPLHAPHSLLSCSPSFPRPLPPPALNTRSSRQGFPHRRSQILLRGLPAVASDAPLPF